MKKLLLILQITLVVLYTGTAQQKPGLIKNYQSQKTDTDSKVYPIPGSHILNKYWKKDLAKLRAYKKSNSDELALLKINKPPLNFTDGQTYSWWATNMNDSSPNYLTEYSVPSTCRAVGNNCFIFVEDQLWTSGRVNQAAVDAMKAAWEERTPADASKGIYQLDVEYFGNPPDVDNNPRIFILILDIIDGYTSGGYIAGYFNPINEFTELEVQLELGLDRHSNHAEIYYIDGDPASLTTSPGVTSASSTTAHEFQHMIFFNYEDEDGKETFINEGMSEVASKLCGYTLDGPGDYYSNTNVDFFPWGVTDNIFDDYSRAATFSWYLIEQFGTDVAKDIVQNQEDGPACYTHAFNSVGSELNFTDVLKNFALAAQINDTAYDPRYGFTIPISMEPSALTHLFPVVSGAADSVMPYGTRYIEFVSGQSISININSTGNIEVKAIATGNAGINLDNVALGTTYTLGDFGINYSNLVLAVTNLTSTKTYFTYSATASGGSGSVELKYDLTEPTGYLQGVGDTVCVWFDGVAGSKIDSIRVALRRAGSMSGGIWEYTGELRPTPLGNKLASITATLPINYVPQPPYPIPWPNWATINLISSSIDASKAFAVAFVNQGNDLTQPRVMITESPLPSELTSFTYIAEDGEWYYQPSNYSGDSVYTYLIRAYVSVPTSIDNPDILQVPVSYVLHQNYPNPFNPTTVIRYKLKVRSEVGLRIYDILGREIATLVNEVKDAGDYTIEWDGRNSAGRIMSSGVYFYQLKCENGFVDTKKMVLMK